MKSFYQLYELIKENTSLEAEIKLAGDEAMDQLPQLNGLQEYISLIQKYIQAYLSEWIKIYHDWYQYTAQPQKWANYLNEPLTVRFFNKLQLSCNTILNLIQHRAFKAIAVELNKLQSFLHEKLPFIIKEKEVAVEFREKYFMNFNIDLYANNIGVPKQVVEYLNNLTQFQKYLNVEFSRTVPIIIEDLGQR